MNAKKALSQEQRELIQQHVKRLETKTSAEVVCAIATESGRYDRAEAIVGIVTAVFALGLATFGCHYFAHPGDWQTDGASLLIQIVSVVAGFIIGNFFAAWCHPLRRIFVSQEQLTQETQRSAAHVFCGHSLGQTRSRSGILIYISLFEHRIVVLPDQKCREVLTDNVIKDLCDSAASKLKTGSASDAITFMLDQLFDPLSKSLPAERELNENELADHVLIIH